MSKIIFLVESVSYQNQAKLGRQTKHMDLLNIRRFNFIQVYFYPPGIFLSLGVFDWNDDEFECSIVKSAESPTTETRPKLRVKIHFIPKI